MSRIADEVAELEEELDEERRERRHLEDRVSAMQTEIDDAEEKYDELSDRHHSFVQYIEQIAPGAHNAWLIANKLES